MNNKKGFSLLEVLLSVIILGMFIGTVITIYISIRGADSKMVNKRLLTSEASDLIDEIHEAALNYTIDYEEYFNRSNNVNDFTTYGNSGLMYYCGDSSQVNTYFRISNSIGSYGLGCPEQGYQKYLEYYSQHRHIYFPNNLNSEDNPYMGDGPIAIVNNTGIDYLYLINGDGDERYYFRRVYKTGKDLNGDNAYEGVNEKLFTIQALKLKGFDAGEGHDYTKRGAYDGFIDTWACDTVQGYQCHGSSGLQNGYNLPEGIDDGRIDLTSDKVTVSDLKIDIYPTKDPYLAVEDTMSKIDPYAKISFTMNMYGQESEDEITVSTTLSFKNSYRRFPIIEYTGYIPSE